MRKKRPNWTMRTCSRVLRTPELHGGRTGDGKPRVWCPEGEQSLRVPAQ